MNSLIHLLLNSGSVECTSFLHLFRAEGLENFSKIDKRGGGGWDDYSVLKSISISRQYIFHAISILENKRKVCCLMKNHCLLYFAQLRVDFCLK